MRKRVPTRRRPSVLCKCKTKLDNDNHYERSPVHLVLSVVVTFITAILFLVTLGSVPTYYIQRYRCSNPKCKKLIIRARRFVYKKWVYDDPITA